MTAPAPRAALTVAVGVVAAAAGLVLGLLLSGGLTSGAPAEGSVDAGFARDMARHHDQAVEMSVLVRDRTDDPAVRQLALDIELTQQHQSGQMRGWLAAWGLPAESAAAPMAWAGEGHGHGSPGGGDDGAALMPGLATPEQMARLEASSGVEAERLFLSLMVPHHEGGVDMARLAVDDAARREVRALADSVIRSQTAEITLLEELLDERGGPVEDL